MYVERGISDRFRMVSGEYNIVAVVGARQAGKTTFLKEHAKQTRSSYVLLDDPDARNLFEEDVKKFEKQYMEGFDMTVLDEVQYCKDAGRNLKYLADTGKRMWITSSSEIILSKNVLSYLVGRVSIIKLYPFSLQEFLTAMNQKEVTPQILERAVWEHMTYGGYPKVVVAPDIEMKKVILKDLYDTMILKDIAQTFSIEDVRSLEEFSKYLAINTGNLLSYEKASGAMKLSFQTVKKYLDAMEKSYLIFRTQPFYTNKTKEITKQPKVYFIDTGLRNAIARSFETGVAGGLFENYVASELVKAGLEPKYWKSKTGAEVDFVVEKDGSVIPIEVKLDAEPDKVERSLRSFVESYSPQKAIVVSYKGKKGTLKVNECEVVFTDVMGLKNLLKL